jgi:transcriptional regulator with XRE-family HTH domain
VTVAERFGHNLHMARREARMSQEDFATEVFLTRAVISRIENGHRYPCLDYIVRMAEACGVQVRDLHHGIA